MFPPFHQYYPEELYLGIDNPPATDKENNATEPKNGFRKTGIEFFDIFMNNLYRHGMRTSKFHAYLLGIEPNELCFTIQTLTGMTYSQFTTKCIILMTKDLLMRRPDDVKVLPGRLGFLSYSGFYRFLKRHTKKTPTGRVVLP